MKKLNYIPSLDGLRAVAILLVFVGHDARLPQFYRPSVGVTIFFFLSGYLITTLLRMEAEKTRTIRLGDFYLRRALRILPPFYIVMALGIIITLTSIVPGDLSLGGAVSSGLFVSNYWILDTEHGIPTAMRIFWSLAVEEHFYLLFPLIYIGLRRWLPGQPRQQAGVLVGICMVILAWRLYLTYGAHEPYFDRIYMATDTRADSLLWGCVLAIVANPFLDRQTGPDWAWKWLALPVGLVALYVGQDISDKAQSYGLTVQALALWLIFTTVIRFPNFGPVRILSWKPVAFIGVLSYSLYLVHRFVILWAADHLASVNRWAVALFSFVVSLGLAYLMHRLVERPCARLRKRLSHAGEPEEDDRVKIAGERAARVVA